MTNPSELQRQRQDTVVACLTRSTRRRRGSRFWRDIVSELLASACPSLTERDVSFLATIQEEAHRGRTPTERQQEWIRSIAARIEESRHDR